jgi:hypothetical protein
MEKNTPQKRQITLKVTPPLFDAIALETDNKQEWLRKLAEKEILHGKNGRKYATSLKKFHETNASEHYEEALKELEKAKAK